MGVETPVPVMTLSGIPTATSEEVPVAPIDLVRESVSRASSWSGGQPNPGTTAGAQGAVPAFPISGGSSLSGPSVIAGSDGGGVLSGIPDQRRVEIESSIEGAQGDVTVVIPIDQGTESLAFSLHAMPGQGPGDAPIVDGMMLVDREGDPIAQFAPPWNMNPAPPSVRSVNLSFEDAPEDGNLLVQISVPSSNSSATGTVSTSEQQLPFLMEIQRQELGSAAAIGAGILWGGPTTSLVRSGIGALTTNTMGGPGSDSSPSADSVSILVSEDGASATPMIADSGDSFPADSDWGQDPSGGFNVRVTSGPLASRSASALGPALATISDDMAPPVDRHERALSQSIDESESDDESEAKLRRLEYAQIEGASSSSQDASTSRSPNGDTCVALAGLGAFPLKVTSLRRPGDDDELESLLASLPRSLEQDDLPTILAAQDHEQDDLSTDIASSSHPATADRVAPDYLTAACGLALGLGLTAGPLLPDILALISSGSSRWRRNDAYWSSSAKPASIPGTNGGIGNWLNSPLSTRIRRAGC